jgi:hypothetical protein
VGCVGRVAERAGGFGRDAVGGIRRGAVG